MDDDLLSSTLVSSLKNQLYDGISVEAFVEHVWQIPQKTISKVLVTEYFLHPACIDDYRLAYEYPEEHCLLHGYYRSITNGLLTHADQALGFEHRPARETTGFVSNGEQPREAVKHPVLDWAVMDLITVLAVPDSLFGDGADSPKETTRSLSISEMTGQKRKHLGKHDDTDPKRICQIQSNDFTEDEMFLISEASRAMSASNRHYITGVYVDCFTVTLWYFDHACVIRTTSFDFAESPEKLALVIYAVESSQCQYGFSPFVVPAHVASLTAGECVENIKGTQILFPPYTPGRAPDAHLVVDAQLYRDHGIVGRGTSVYHVSLLHGDGIWEEDLALKLSWALATRPWESSLIWKLSSSIPEWQAHLPDIKYSRTFTAQQLNLPRVKLFSESQPSGFEDRNLRVFLAPKYNGLWEVDSVEEFEAVFKHCVYCHHHAFERGGILHCDLSENNLMFHRQEGQVTGILNDWDMASVVNDRGEVEGPLTGTLPFIAIDLLSNRPPPHQYLHDLESFFYVLVWATIHFDLKNKRRLNVRQIAMPWLSPRYSAVEASKRMFLYSDLRLQLFANVVREEFRGIWTDWVLPLRALFADSTLGNPVTFDQYITILERRPQSPTETSQRSDDTMTFQEMSMQAIYTIKGTVRKWARDSPDQGTTALTARNSRSNTLPDSGSTDSTGADSEKQKLSAFVGFAINRMISD